MKKYYVHIIWAVIVIVAFVGGMFYGKASVPANRGFAGQFGGAGSSSTRTFGGGRGAGGGFVSGQVTAVNPDSITVQLPNGNSEVVFYSSSTQIVKLSPVAASALATGTSVMIGGTANSDGSVTAQTIQIREGSAPTMNPGGANRGQ